MAASIVQVFRAFAYNNAWANHRLLTACANLSQQELEAERTGFFPSLRGTLNHIHVIDHFYIDALEGGWLGPKAWDNQIPYLTVTELAPAQAAMDKRLITICNALTPDQLDSTVRVNRDTRVQTERTSAPLRISPRIQITTEGPQHGAQRQEGEVQHGAAVECRVHSAGDAKN